MLRHPWFDLAWSPFAEILRADEDWNRWFDGVDRTAPNELPAFNIAASEHGLRVVAALPGFRPDEVEAFVERDQLVVRGERKTESNTESEVRLRSERSLAKFERRFALPFRVESSEVAAQLSRGVLTLELPRAREERPLRIAVQTSTATR